MNTELLLRPWACPWFGFCAIMFKECFQAKRQPVVLIQVERS